MRRNGLVFALVIALVLGSALAVHARRTAAQAATPAAAGVHPFVGTWVVDTLVGSQTDSPEIAIVTPDGRLAGLGANRVAGGTWEPIDAHSALLTLVSVFDKGGIGGYVVIRGPHVVDATGNHWTCACTVTIVGADGQVQTAMRTQATGDRLPVQGPEQMGQPLPIVPTWTPPRPTATPTA
jgi:hypothetical protein